MTPATSLMCVWLGMSCLATHPTVSGEITGRHHLPAAASVAAPSPVIAGPFAAPVGYQVISASVMAQGRPAVLFGTSPDANYAISQWNAPASMGPFQAVPDGVEASDAFSSVVLSPSGVTLHQDGSKAPCGKELDEFIEPQKIAKIGPFPPMSELASFSVFGTLTASASAASTGTCPGLHGGADYELEFLDTTVQPEQMLWYQVQLQSSHSLSPSVEVWTGAQEPHPHVTGKVTNFFVVDSLAEYGAPQVPPDTATRVSLDLLPRLTALMTLGAFGMDANPAHWTLVGETYGQAVWNDTVAQSTWSGWVPAWTEK